MRSNQHGREQEAHSDFMLHCLSPLQSVLQTFVNDFVESVFNISLHTSPQGASAVYANLGTASVPPAIKFLFDFLDQEAIDLGIHHPNILHVWKCNRLAPSTSCLLLLFLLLLLFVQYSCLKLVSVDWLSSANTGSTDSFRRFAHMPYGYVLACVCACMRACVSACVRA